MDRLTVFKRESLLTAPQFAKRIGMSRRHVYRLIDKGRAEGGILAFRFGGARGYRIPESEVERLKCSCQIDLGDE